MAKEISIQSVLNQINSVLDEGQPRLFQIGWVRKTGEGRGTFKSLSLARKHGKTGMESRSGTKGGFRMKENKTIMLDDMEAGTPVYVGIETIIQFNGAAVRH
jgi:hypothetical protein